MADNNTNTVINTNTVRMTEKQKVKEITDRLEELLTTTNIFQIPAKENAKPSDIKTRKLFQGRKEMPLCV